MSSEGVYKQWTGLLEWWNGGIVDWILMHTIIKKEQCFLTLVVTILTLITVMEPRGPQLRKILYEISHL